MDTPSSAIFQPLKIKGVEFKNRLIRSSIGGRTAYYDGTVNDSWYRFESRFAEGGVGAIISATLTVDHERWSPLEYPALSDEKFIGPLKQRIERIQRHDCRYIIQIGDPGYHTQTSLIPEAADALSPSAGFDFLYGYTNRRRPMSVADIKRTVQNFVNAAKRVREIGCDGLEITASKGYLVHQFLNPATNRRKDAYGGQLEDRFRLLKEIVEAVSNAIPDRKHFVFGVRLSANDYSRRPWLALFRLGPRLVPSLFYGGNDLKQTLEIGGWLKTLGVDYLHISNGFGFINPMENPGGFPTPEVRSFCDSTRHLSAKATVRSFFLNLASLIPGDVLHRVLNIGWRKGQPPDDPVNMVTNLEDAIAFKKQVGLPVIVNGGFQQKWQVEQALSSCDFVSMARPLLANPELPKVFNGEVAPKPPCTFCNRCAVNATLYPLGCYDLSRFMKDEHGNPQSIEKAREAMQDQIEAFNQPLEEPSLLFGPGV